MKRTIILFTFLSATLWQQVVGQSSTSFKIANDRLLWHDNIDKQQKRMFKDGSVLKLSPDPQINRQIEEAIIDGVDQLQQRIELDSQHTGNIKTKYLRSLETMVRGYNDNQGKKDYSPALAPALVKAYEQSMELDMRKESIKPVIIANEYGVGKILVECFLYPSENPGIAGSRIELIRKYCGMHPDEILPVLRNNPNVYFADSLIKVAAYRDVRKLYDYAAARNALGERIRNHPDSMVRMVSKMANSKSGQLYFPFLDNLLRGKITFADIDSVKTNDLSYYRLMVKTRLDYSGRLLPPTRDTAREMKALTVMMARKAKEYFIREINALHAVDNEAIRFKKLEGLSPQELYYLCVLGEDELYTSSYLKGVYPRIWQRMPNPRGDSLLLSVHADYFRKFIKMAAGYNTLNDFLGRMDKANANTLMKAFVIKLEKTEGLEDAVDVADSYSSITDKNPELANFILQQAKWNYDRNLRSGDKRGQVIYQILKILFESADTTRNTDLSAQLGIPPIYNVAYKKLSDDSGRVVQQVFFYGDDDKDGQKSYMNFMGLFRSRSEWKITENRQWTTIKSTKGKPVWIFANKPLYGEDDPDDKAQVALADYLYDNKLKPTVVIHRGHSYHLASTLKKLPGSAQIVVLGSCGGYNNLNDVLTISEDAHIISSKQIGTLTVNEPILQSINNTLVNGKNIDWIGMWRELETRFKNDAAAKEKFDDYIPPYKNLGAIFIKAYKRAMEESQ